MQTKEKKTKKKASWLNNYSPLFLTIPIIKLSNALSMRESNKRQYKHWEVIQQRNTLFPDKRQSNDLVIFSGVGLTGELCCWDVTHTSVWNVWNEKHNGLIDFLFFEHLIVALIALAIEVFGVKNKNLPLSSCFKVRK